MAVVEMKKMSFIGFISDREEILDYMMKKGAVEIKAIEATEDHQLINVNDELSKVEDNMAKVKSAVLFLSRFDQTKKKLFSIRQEVSEAEFAGIAGRKAAMLEKVKDVLVLEECINALKTKGNRLENQKESLIPWTSLSVPLELPGTNKTRIIKGNLPVIIPVDEVTADLENQSEYVHYELLGQDKDHCYMVVICPSEEYKDVLSILKKYGFNEFYEPTFKGTALQNIERIDKDIADLELEIQKAREKAREYSERLIDIKVLHGALQVERDKLKAKNRMISTESTFAFQSWVPAGLVDGIAEKLISRWNCFAYVEDPKEDEPFPVLLKNPPIAGSVEMITEMYSLPDCRETDPNRVMAPFFIMFFGLMLGDAGYGLLLTLFTGFAVWKIKMEDSTKRFMKMMMYCGIATIFWGAMFGGWFGDLLSRLLGGPDVNVALWFNPVGDPQYLLMWSLFFGVIHMFTGIGMNGYNYIREKKYLDVVVDTLFRYILFTGLIMVVMPYIPAMDMALAQKAAFYGKYVFLIGVVLTVLGGIKGAKNIFTGLFRGIAKLYDVVSFLSDVLSYSRILALGLATSVIGAIVNQMAVMGGFSITGVILFIVVFFAGHSLNLALNTLSAYVHSSRLQYIEFFGKFYKGGGKAFSPLKIDTEYIRVK